MEALGAADYSDTMLGAMQHIDTIPCYDCDLGYFRESCGCYRNRIYTAILVQIAGSPVTTRPSDSTYRIRIWHCTDRKAACTPARFIDEPCVNEFSIAPAEDPIDLERRYGEILRTYDASSIIATNTTFRAPVARESYIKDFEQRVRNILSMKDKSERPAMDVAHIAPRKKGYSHASLHTKVSNR